MGGTGLYWDKLVGSGGHWFKLVRLAFTGATFSFPGVRVSSPLSLLVNRKRPPRRALAPPRLALSAPPPLPDAPPAPD